MLLNLNYKKITLKFKTISAFRTIPANVPNPKRNRSKFYSSHKQSRTLSIRLTLENYSTISKLAFKHNVGISQLVRDLLADGMTKEMLTSYKYALSKNDRSSLQQIERCTHYMSNNINQIATSNSYFNKVYDPYDLLDDTELVKKHDEYDQDIKKLTSSFNRLAKKVNQLSQLSQK